MGRVGTQVVVALLVLSSPCAVTAWTCSANIVAGSSEPQKFSERSVQCLPGGAGEATGNLTVLLHPVLSGGSFSGTHKRNMVYDTNVQCVSQASPQQ